MPDMRVKKRSNLAPSRDEPLRVSKGPSVDAQIRAKGGGQTAQDYWRTHTYMNGHEQELVDGGMCSGVNGKRVFRYCVAYLK
jgi:hypothetical protein